jgi:hypothetical protein
MAVKVVTMAAAMAVVKRVVEGMAAALAPTALATMGAGIDRGRQQSTNKRQNFC